MSPSPVGGSVVTAENALGQPVGALLPGWTPRPVPSAPVLPGRSVRLERLDPERHAADLLAADALDADGSSWTYLPYGPFADIAAYRVWADEAASATDRIFYAVVDTDPASPSDGRAVGVLAYLRLQPEVGSLEVGHVHFSPLLQRRRGATEAQYLMMRHAFDDLGYRRYEWKCDALNAPSRAAAARLGFVAEGVHRQSAVVRGRNRDTAWFSILDGEWPVLRTRFEAWLDPANVDADGRQRRSLGGG